MMRSKHPHLERLSGLCPTTARLLAIRLASTAHLPMAALRQGAVELEVADRELVAQFAATWSAFEREMSRGGVRLAAGLMGRGLARHLMLRNQYLASRTDWAAIGETLYHELLFEILETGSRARRLPQAVAGHQVRLRGVMRQHHIADCNDEPVCASYSPELQLRVLGLDPATAPGPILDIGCGETGDLVHHLRALGRVDVNGIDMLCESGGPLIRASWFETPWPGETWGTILAHHSFALHAHRAHVLGSGAQARMYVGTYMAILRALKPGGSLRYSPAMPFVEDLLPSDQWQIERRPVMQALEAVLVTRVSGRARAQQGAN